MAFKILGPNMAEACFVVIVCFTSTPCLCRPLYAFGLDAACIGTS